MAAVIMVSCLVIFTKVSFGTRALFFIVVWVVQPLLLELLWVFPSLFISP